MRPDLRNLVALADRGRHLRNLATGRPAGHARAARLLNTLPVRNASAVATGRTVVRLYGAIGQGWYDDDAVSAADLARTLDGIGPNGIDLHINSGGGDVFDGIAMHAMLIDHPSNVKVVVDGIAASAASFIAMAADPMDGESGGIRVQKPAKMMIHNAAGLAWGNKHVMRELADVLDEIDATIATMYADRSGRDAAEFSALMDQEKWMGSAEALDLGLADAVLNDRAAVPPPAEEDPEEDDPEDAPEDPAPEEKASKKEPVEDRRSALIRAHHAGLTQAARG